MEPIDTPLKIYRIRVGHLEFHIQARNPEDAIQLARRHLGRELPRLYDVIRTLTAARFQVDAAA
jgi:hypothetical protein